MNRQGRFKIILDTDIGDDIDDAIALSFALGCAEFELLGVTVVYGDVVTRARVARRVLRAWGREDVPVVAGYERPMGFQFHPGTAPEVPSQKRAVAGDDAAVPRTPAADAFIAETVRRHGGEVYVLTIGAMTNVAAALCADPSLAEMMAGVISLAGYVPPRQGVPEWNVRYDPIAAASVARSGVRWTAIGADVQGDNGLTRAELDALAEAGAPATEVLTELIILMKRYKGVGDPRVRTIRDVDRVHVADVFTLASLLIGEQMDLRAGRIEVDAAGALSFTPDGTGPHRLAFARVPGASYRGEILRRLLACPPRP